MTAPHNKAMPTGADERYPGAESEGVRSAREITKHMPLTATVPTLTARTAPGVVNSIAHRSKLLEKLDRLEQTLLTDPPNPPAAPADRAARAPMTTDPYLLRP